MIARIVCPIAATPFASCDGFGSNGALLTSFYYRRSNVYLGCMSARDSVVKGPSYNLGVVGCINSRGSIIPEKSRGAIRR